MPKDHAALEQMARNKNCDQVWDIFQQFANMLISPHWSAYVLDDQYTNLINGVGERRKLLAFAHLKPSLLDGFATADRDGSLLQAVGAVSALVGSRCAVPTAQADHEGAAIHEAQQRTPAHHPVCHRAGLVEELS